MEVQVLLLAPKTKQAPIGACFVFLVGYPNKPPVLLGERKTSGATIKRVSYKQAQNKKG